MNPKCAPSKLQKSLTSTEFFVLISVNDNTKYI